MGRDLVTEYRAACQSYRDHWYILDDHLYALCRQYPDHQSDLHVNAKLMIIGRTYATGLERAIQTKAGITAIGQAVDHLCMNHLEVDRLIQRLCSIGTPNCPESLTEIVQIHGKFCALIQTITRNNHSVPSFASKYLHFHCPTVPIYDAYANASVQKLYRWKSDFDLLTDKSGVNLDYYWFVCRFNQLYSALQTAQENVSTKLVDYFLLYRLNPDTVGLNGELSE